MDASTPPHETTTLPTGLEVLVRRPARASSRPPLLFVHGAWHAAWCWDEHFLPWFAAAGYDAIALSLRGHGGSSGRARLNRHRLRDYVEDVRAVVASLDRPPVLVGHSLGGAVVQRLLRHAPPALAGAALLASTPPRGAWRATAVVARRHPVAFLAANATRDLARVLGTPTLVKDVLFTAESPDLLVARCHERLQSESYRAFLDLLMPHWRRPAPLDLPVFVLGARDDRLIATSEVRATARTWNTEPVIVAGLSHDVMLDHRWDKAATALHAWLDTAVGQTSVLATDVTIAS